MGAPLEFNRVTFGLPVETFRVAAYIALEERLPVVTEFILRLLRICGRLPLVALRDYFGFTDSEALAVVESLSRQGLLDIIDDEVQLSPFSSERFEESGGEHPRFSKVQLERSTVTFDLISFTPLKSFVADLPTDNVLKLNAEEEALGQSLERARNAYRQRYSEIASLMRADLRERSFGVYSIEDIESKRRTYAPVPVRFSVDEEGQVKRDIDESFARVAPPELVNFVNEQVTNSIPRTIAVGVPGMEEFIDTFDIQVMRRYLTGRRFDLTGYMADVHVSRSVTYPRGVTPLFGNLYLEANRERIVARVKNRREGKRRNGKLLTSLAWLAPDYSLWGRGDAFAETISALSSELQSANSGDRLYMFAYAEQGEEGDVTNLLRVRGLRELHFSRPLAPDGKLMAGRLELLLYPTGFVAALCHIPLPGNRGLLAPLGFLSTLPKHLDTAQKLLRKAMSGARYGRRARFSQYDTQLMPNSFEEGCAFLNYDGVSRQSNAADIPEDEEDSS